YFITCDEVIKNDAGEITELHCSYDPETKGGNAPDGRKVKGTIHWVSVKHALQTEVRLYDRLCIEAEPDKQADWKSTLNPDSMKIINNAFVEPSLIDA
ncbi:MAG: glutamine--tRNA ligase, partial [Gammaproteobacteria bacterium]|nr:glutamine--tRNA ligase [Gammaproteobacteria bacterium]